MSEFSTHAIDEYLLGRLSAEEQEKVERQAQDDPELARLIEERRALMAKVEAYGDYEIKQQLRQVHRREMGRKAQIRRLRWGGAAAAILLLATTCWFLLKPSESVPPEQLYIAYYESYPLNFTTRDGQAEQILAEADRLYNAQRFEEALPLFQQLFSSDPTLSNVSIGIGICHMEAERYSAAIQQFQPLVKADFDPFKEQAIWYTALAHLKQNQLGDAKALLQQIIDNPRSSFYERAIELEKKIPDATSG